MFPSLSFFSLFTGVPNVMSHINSLKSVIQNNFLSEFLVSHSSANHTPENVQLSMYSGNQPTAHSSPDRMSNGNPTLPESLSENHDCAEQVTGDLGSTEIGHHENTNYTETESSLCLPDIGLPSNSVCSVVTVQCSGTENLDSPGRVQPLANNHHNSANHGEGALTNHSDSLNSHEISLICNKDLLANHEDSLNHQENSLLDNHGTGGGQQVDSVDHHENSLNAPEEPLNHLEESLSGHEDSLHHTEDSLSNVQHSMDHEDSTNHLSDSLSPSDNSVVGQVLDKPTFPETTPSLSPPGVVQVIMKVVR